MSDPSRPLTERLEATILLMDACGWCPVDEDDELYFSCYMPSPQTVDAARPAYEITRLEGALREILDVQVSVGVPDEQEAYVLAAVIAEVARIAKAARAAGVVPGEEESA